MSNLVNLGVSSIIEPIWGLWRQKWVFIKNDNLEGIVDERKLVGCWQLFAGCGLIVVAVEAHT